MDAIYDKCASILEMPINLFKDIWSLKEKIKDAKDVKDAEEYEW